MSGSHYTMCTPLTKSLMNQGTFNCNYCFISFLPLLILRRESTQRSTVSERHCSLPPPPTRGCFAIWDALCQYNLGKVSVGQLMSWSRRLPQGIAGAGEQLHEGEFQPCGSPPPPLCQTPPMRCSLPKHKGDSYTVLPSC